MSRHTFFALHPRAIVEEHLRAHYRLGKKIKKRQRKHRDCRQENKDRIVKNIRKFTYIVSVILNSSKNSVFHFLCFLLSADSLILKPF